MVCLQSLCQIVSVSWFIFYLMYTHDDPRWYAKDCTIITSMLPDTLAKCIVQRPACVYQMYIRNPPFETPAYGPDKWIISVPSFLIILQRTHYHPPNREFTCLLPLLSCQCARTADHVTLCWSISMIIIIQCIISEDMYSMIYTI